MQNLKDQRSTSASSQNLKEQVSEQINRMFPPMPSAEEEAEQTAKFEAQYQAQTQQEPKQQTIPQYAPPRRTYDEPERRAYTVGFALRRYPRRFYRTVIYFTLLFLRLLAWEVFIRRIFGEGFVARGRANRTRFYSRRFRALAVGMGGVMIKLGQFISTRVDILPPEITDELIGLQDKVPVVPFDYIKRTVERELGTIRDRYLWLNEEPIAAASFGQVHRAQLHNGDRVVVKVQRPNILQIVKTDLAALDLVAKMSMLYGPIRRRANMPALMDEFAKVLWEELDYLSEADHALTFASLYKDDPGVYVPSVYLEHSTRYVLTLEDVTSIKINDYAALERAGIDRREVAERLLNSYLDQVFEYRFFHADPHAGNIFVYPLPESAIKAMNGSYRGKGRPFYLIFIDFGMMGRLTETLKEGLRETLIAVATQDATGLVNSYKKLGVLLPSADTKRIEEATRVVFDKVWGLNMQQMQNIPYEEMVNVASEFSDLLLSMPFQMPQDFIYLSRAVGILSGMCTGLDPRFDPWQQMQPFTQRLLSESGDRTRAALAAGTVRAGLEVAGKVVRDWFNRVTRLPQLADTVLSRADRGELSVRVQPDDFLVRQMNRVEASVNQLAIGVIFATTALASTLLYINDERQLGTIGYVLAAIMFLLILRRGRG
jgi:predicted unusual protein kinase regulating ubiquinone biosynthesis (AarF/ABC1/UbiB family)